MIEIYKDSEAYRYLKAIMAADDTYMVRVDDRASGVALKRNEGMWTPTLDCELVKTCKRCGAVTNNPIPDCGKCPDIEVDGTNYEKY